MLAYVIILQHLWIHDDENRLKEHLFSIVQTMDNVHIVCITFHEKTWLLSKSVFNQNSIPNVL